MKMLCKKYRGMTSTDSYLCIEVNKHSGDCVYADPAQVATEEGRLAGIKVTCTTLYKVFLDATRVTRLELSQEVRAARQECERQGDPMGALIYEQTYRKMTQHLGSRA